MSQVFVIDQAYASPIKALVPPPVTSEHEVQLGKELFHDKSLSKNETISCSSCHDISQGGDDGSRVSTGINNRQGDINSPSIFNSIFDIAQFWDGRALTLEEQIDGPIHNSKEMDNDWRSIVSKLSKNKGLVTKFKSVYGTGVTIENIKSAIVAYQSQLITLNSPFDQFLRGDVTAISEEAKEGYSLFSSLGCISCHQGKNIGGNMYQKLGLLGNYYKDRGNITQADYGRYNVTKREIDRYKFKVPSLRNVSETSPYFHDGSAKTLEDAVKTMAKYQLGRSIKDEHVKKIIQFLESLTGEIPEDLLP